MIYGLNNLDICACDIGDAYLNDICQEKLWTKAGSEYGSEKEYVFLIVRTLYGLKPLGAAWRANISETLN